ncbi:MULTISPECIES: hypothetical protein [Pseudomonas]|uniref:hypothetical protein n=1 Tax=Pseudomonas TaxID=286 RepID=UPI0006427F62|nr:hypothetical protein [Pseudomonas fluorescens]
MDFIKLDVIDEEVPPIYQSDSAARYTTFSGAQLKQRRAVIECNKHFPLQQMQLILINHLRLMENFEADLRSGPNTAAN